MVSPCEKFIVIETMFDVHFVTSIQNRYIQGT